MTLLGRAKQEWRAIVTEIDADFDGDAHFPALDPRHWHETARTPGSTEPSHAFVTYERSGPSPA